MKTKVYITDNRKSYDKKARRFNRLLRKMCKFGNKSYKDKLKHYNR